MRSVISVVDSASSTSEVPDIIAIDGSLGGCASPRLPPSRRQCRHRQRRGGREGFTYCCWSSGCFVAFVLDRTVLGETKLCQKWTQKNVSKIKKMSGCCYWFKFWDGMNHEFELTVFMLLGLSQKDDEKLTDGGEGGIQPKTVWRPGNPLIPNVKWENQGFCGNNGSVHGMRCKGCTWNTMSWTGVHEMHSLHQSGVDLWFGLVDVYTNGSAHKPPW